MAGLARACLRAACLPSRDGNICWGHRFPHCSTGGNWSTSPSSVLSCSPKAKVSLYRSRTFSFIGLASSMTWVMAAGGWIGLNGESSVPEGGCNFTFIDLGTAACSTMLLTGNGAVFSMETTTTSTSGRPGGHSLAKWKRMRKPFLS